MSEVAEAEAIAPFDPTLREKASKVVWGLAWPAVALNSLQVVNNLLDRTFIGHLPGAALTAQGGSITVIFLLFSLAMTVGTASTALVSRAYGAQQRSEFMEANRQCVSFALAGGLVLGVVGLILSNVPAAQLLPPDAKDAQHLMSQYLHAYAFGLPAFFIIQSLAGSMRGIGDTRSPMVISGLQILLHILLNYILIFPPKHMSFGVTIPGFNMGLVGASTALSISAWISATAYLLYSAKTPLGPAFRLALPTKSWAARIFKIALPAAGMAVLRVGSLAAFTFVLRMIPNPNMLVEDFSPASVAIAAMSVGFAVESIMFMPSFGLSIAAASLVGQSLGMRRPDRAERLAWAAGHHGALVTLGLSVPIFIFAPQIVGTMIAAKPQLVVEAATLLRTLCVTETLFAYAMVMIGAMQGAGDTTRPLWITILCMWGLRVPLAWLLSGPLGLHAFGAWLAMSGSQAVQGLMAILLFRQGAWKTKKV